MKKIEKTLGVRIALTAFATLCFMVSALSESMAEKICDCGNTENGGKAENCCWEIDNNGTLIISGVGKMKNYSPSWHNICGTTQTPTWCSRENDIRSVEIKGLDNVGTGVIYSIPRKSIPIKLDNTVERIEDYALRFNYPVLELPDSITYIGKEALKEDNMSQQRTIVIPDTIETLSLSALGYTGHLNNLNIVCKGSDCDRVKALFERYVCYDPDTGKNVTVDLSNNVSLAGENQCNSEKYYWTGGLCNNRPTDGSVIECDEGWYATNKDVCARIKLRYTLPEADELTSNDNENTIEWIFE